MVESRPVRVLLRLVSAGVLAFLYLPLAAAYAFVPISVMVVYLLLARRAGAFENL